MYVGTRGGGRGQYSALEFGFVSGAAALCIGLFKGWFMAMAVKLVVGAVALIDIRLEIWAGSRVEQLGYVPQRAEVLLHSCLPASLAVSSWQMLPIGGLLLYTHCPWASLAKI